MPTTIVDSELATIEHNDELLATHVYTDPVSAQSLLDDQRRQLDRFGERIEELEDRTGKDYQLNYYLALSSLYSQQYRHAQAATPLASALEIVDRRGDLRDRLRCYLAYSGYLSNLKQTDEASDYLERCYQLLKIYPNARLQARAACRHGYLHLLAYGYPKATRKFLEAENLYDEAEFTLSTEDHYFYSLTQAGLGTLHQRSGESDLAIEAFTRAIERCQNHGLRARLPWHRLNLGKELLANDNFTDARVYFESVVAEGAAGSTLALAAAYANLSECDYYTDDAGAAERHLDQAERLYRSLRPAEPVELASIGFMRASRLMDRAAWKQATVQIASSIKEAGVDESTIDPRLLGMAASAYLRLATAYASTEEYALAYRYQCAYDDYRQRHQDQIDLQRQRRFSTQFRAEQREQENERLKLKASQLKLRALRAQMNPHFLYNALNSIQSFISTNDAATASRYLAKFALLMRRSLEYSNRETISLEEERQFLTDYLDINRRLRFEGNLSYTVKVDPELEEDITAVPTMILQPYVENAIEHGLRGLESGHIDVNFHYVDEEHLLATVTDNGIGRERVAEIQARDPNRGEHQSRGTEITESRLRLLGDSRPDPVTIEDLYDAEKCGCGTRVSVRIPLGELSPGSAIR